MPLVNVFERINSEYYQLTSAEKKVADYAVIHQQQTQFMSISELAEEAGVAEATISRFCKRLGYKGYSAFKLAIANATAVKIFDQAINAGWDKEYGGLLYFIDCLGRPPEAYEHDMKLWWPHDEILIASMMIYRDTGDEQYLNWFEKTLDYCKKYFSDPEYGDWFGYLRRDGKPTEPPCKGSTFKGPFHLPRMLIMCDQMIGQILERN